LDRLLVVGLLDSSVKSCLQILFGLGRGLLVQREVDGPGLLLPDEEQGLCSEDRQCIWVSSMERIFSCICRICLSSSRISLDLPTWTGCPWLTFGFGETLEEIFPVLLIFILRTCEDDAGAWNLGFALLPLEEFLDFLLESFDILFPWKPGLQLSNSNN